MGEEDNSIRDREVFETGHVFYDESKMRIVCSRCDGNFIQPGRAEIGGELQDADACTAIAVPSLDIVDEKQLEEKVKKLCPYAGIVADFHEVDGGYNLGEYVVCTRNSKPE